MPHKFAVFIKHRGKFEKFTGDYLCSKGFTPALVAARWRMRIKPIWPSDVFRLYVKDKAVGADWKCIRYLK